jgi:hypothetical protein
MMVRRLARRSALVIDIGLSSNSWRYIRQLAERTVGIEGGRPSGTLA